MTIARRHWYRRRATSPLLAITLCCSEYSPEIVWILYLDYLLRRWWTYHWLALYTLWWRCDTDKAEVVDGLDCGNPRALRDPQVIIIKLNTYRPSKSSPISIVHRAMQLKSTTKPVFVYVVPPSKMTNYSALTDQLGTQVSLNCATPCDDPLTHFPAAVASDRVTK